MACRTFQVVSALASWSLNLKDLRSRVSAMEELQLYVDCFVFFVTTGMKVLEWSTDCRCFFSYLEQECYFWNTREVCSSNQVLKCSANLISASTFPLKVLVTLQIQKGKTIFPFMITYCPSLQLKIMEEENCLIPVEDPLPPRPKRTKLQLKKPKSSRWRALVDEYRLPLIVIGLILLLVLQILIKEAMTLEEEYFSDWK